MSLLRSEAIGRLVDNPSLETIKIGNDDVSICKFSLAVNYGFGDNEKTEFINCVAWRKLAEIIGEHCKKGRKIYVAGRQQTRNYNVEKESVTFRQYRTEWTIEEFEFCDSAFSENNSEEKPVKKKKSPF